MQPPVNTAVAMKASFSDRSTNTMLMFEDSAKTQKNKMSNVEVFHSSRRHSSAFPGKYRTATV